MPTLMATFAASALAWVVEGALPAPAGVQLRAMLSFIVWIVAFGLLKRFFQNLRPSG